MEVNNGHCFECAEGPFLRKPVREPGGQSGGQPTRSGDNGSALVLDPVHGLGLPKGRDGDEEQEECEKRENADVAEPRTEAVAALPTLFLVIAVHGHGLA